MVAVSETLAYFSAASVPGARFFGSLYGLKPKNIHKKIDEALEIMGLSKFADKIGLAFQIKDDILSEEGNPDITGKPVGNDKEHNKCTYVSVFGIEGAKKELEKITNEAVEILEYYGDKAEFLKQLAIYIKDRNK